MNERMKRILVLTHNRLTCVPQHFYNTLKTAITESDKRELSSENRYSFSLHVKEIKIVKSLMGNADIVCSSQAFPSMAFKIYESNPSYESRMSSIEQDLMKLSPLFKCSYIIFIINSNSRRNKVEYEALVQIQGQISISENNI